MDKKKILILAGVVLLLLIIVFSCSAPKNKPEKVAKQYADALFSCKAKKAVNLVSDRAIKQSGSKTRKLYEHTIENICDGYKKNMSSKYGDKYKYKTKIIDSYENQITFYDNTIGDYFKIDGMTVVLDVSFSGKKEMFFGLTSKKVEESTEMTVFLIKEHGKWRVLDWNG